MEGKFTTRASAAILRAFREARRFYAFEVQAEHILLWADPDLFEIPAPDSELPVDQLRRACEVQEGHHS
jgi:hypothetical protein